MKIWTLSVLAVVLISTSGAHAQDKGKKPAPSTYAIKEEKKGLYAISIDVAVQEAATDAWFNQFAQTMDKAAEKVWVLTEGQFYIKEMTIRDNCSDGHVIIMKGCKEADVLREGLGAAQTQFMETSRWYAMVPGRPFLVILLHEMMHGMFKFRDEEGCNCTMLGTQSEGNEIFALCDDGSHRGSGETEKSCWKRLKERYKNLQHPNPAYKPGDRRPGMKVTPQHRKAPDEKRAALLDRMTDLDMQGIQAVNNRQFEQAVAAYQQIVDASPGEPWALYVMACAYSLMGKAAEARDTFKKALENGFEDPEYFRLDGIAGQLRADPEVMKLAEKHMAPK